MAGANLVCRLLAGLAAKSPYRAGVRILDDNLRGVAPGKVGELCIAGGVGIRLAHS